MKKLLSLALVLVMVLSLSAVVFAADPDCMINAPVNGHKYDAYQIFTGDFHDGVLSNIVWGNGITAEGQAAVSAQYGVTTAAEVAALLVTEADGVAFAKAVAPYLTNAIDLTAEGSLHHPHDDFTQDHYGTPVGAGYYLVKDHEAVTGHDAATNYILHVVGNVFLNPKSSVPSVDKQQSTTDGSGYQHDPLDVNISDNVYYELTGTLPNTLDDYATYKYVFHDTLSAGLTYNDDTVKVTIDGVEVKGYTVDYTGNALTVSFADILQAQNKETNAVVPVTKNSVVKVYYSAKLNVNAVIGGAGNPNKVYLEFSNDPTWNGTGGPTGETPEVQVVVFTYQILADKQDNVDQSKHLQGAKFLLWNQGKTKAVVLDADGKVQGWSEHYEGDGCAADAHTDVTLATVVTSGADGKFKFVGLDAGTYFLEETLAPAGYNKLAAPVELKILATYENNAIKELKVDVGSVKVQNVDKANGSASIVIRNAAGSTLPSTGGMGTTLFYVLGSVMVLGAAVLLITKKRMNVK